VFDEDGDGGDISSSSDDGAASEEQPVKRKPGGFKGSGAFVDFRRMYARGGSGGKGRSGSLADTRVDTLTPPLAPTSASHTATSTAPLVIETCPLTRLVVFE
jgi:hypothetical protein